jgi:hypothetical protein
VNETEPVVGRCWRCGYSLRGLDSRRCPECGREFDPADRRSTNPGPDVGRIAQQLIKYPNWPTFIVALIAFALVAWGTGWPHNWWPNFSDWPLLWAWLRRQKRPSSLTHEWNAYATGAVLTAALLVWILARLGFRSATLFLRALPGDERPHPRWPLAVVPLLLLAAFFLIATGGNQRIGREWANDAAGWTPLLSISGGFGAPITLTKAQQMDIVEQLVEQGPNSNLRRIGIKILVEQMTDDGPAVLPATIQSVHDKAMLILELHVLGLYRNPENADLIETFLSDARPSVRAAAADALGIIYAPMDSILAHQSNPLAWDTNIAGSPPISVFPLINRAFQRSHNIVSLDESDSLTFYTDRFVMAPPQRERLLRLMLSGKQLAEREAAARALLYQPPADYKLRVAEWGVWLSNGTALEMARSVAADIPPFVHRTGNPLATLAVPDNRPMVITKPIIHLTVGDPMAVDIEVRIRDGRTWLAYPMPDDFVMEVDSLYRPSGDSRPPQRAYSGASQASPLLSQFDSPTVGDLPETNLRSGFPWIQPAHRLIGRVYMTGPSPLGFGMYGTEPLELGVCWQSLIVSPKKLPWMQESAVPSDPKMAWWQRLRGVDCAWVSSRGESERFLYYDGPTRLQLSHRVALSNDYLHFLPNPATEGNETISARIEDLKRGGPLRHYPPNEFDSPAYKPWSLFVEVKDGRIRGEVVPGYAPEFQLFAGPSLEQDAVEAELKKEILAVGLTESEAQGMLDCWREDFFRKPGTRLLMMLTPDEYDAFCPMVVHPDPTERVRVGIVMTELRDLSGR